MVTLTAEAAAEHHFVLTAKEIEAAAQEGVNRILFTFPAVPAAITHQARAGLFIRIAGHIHQLRVKVGFSMHAVDVRFPAIIETLGQVSEDAGAVFIRIGPVRRDGLAAIVVSLTSVAVPGRQSAPGWVGGMAFLILIPYRESRAVGDIRVHHAVEEFLPVVVVIHEAVVVLITGDQTTPYLT
ncbi:Uncharacterised protein [Enterobacter hormaechei]|nr:Uncharacterised protein [Enterobacter hormaechei]